MYTYQEKFNNIFIIFDVFFNILQYVKYIINVYAFILKILTF